MEYYIIIFLIGMALAFGVVIYLILGNLPTITTIYHKSKMYEANQESVQILERALQVSIGTAEKVNHILVDRTQSIPSPTAMALSQNTQFQGTDGRTDAQNELKHREKLIVVKPAIQKAGVVSSNSDYIIFTRNIDNKIYRALRPYDDDEELQPFENEEGEKLGYYTGLCQNSRCINLFVTTETHAKFCDDKCRKQHNRN